MDLSDLEFFVTVARAYPRLSATVAVLAALVLIGANVRPSEEWALRHSCLFMGIRVCRAIFANAVKAISLLAEWRRDGSLAAVRAFFDRGRVTDPSGPPSPAAAPVAPERAERGEGERGYSGAWATCPKGPLAPSTPISPRPPPTCRPPRPVSTPARPWTTWSRPFRK